MNFRLTYFLFALQIVVLAGFAVMQWFPPKDTETTAVFPELRDKKNAVKAEEPVLRSKPFAPPPEDEFADTDENRKRQSSRPKPSRATSLLVWLFWTILGLALVGAAGYLAWRTFLGRG